MDFQVIPVAEASVKTLIQSIDRVIINPIIFFLFAVAMVYFLYGVAQYFLSGDSEEVRKKAKSQMLWGIIGLFIMVAVFGIMRVIINTFGVTNVSISNNGTVNVDGTQATDTTVKDNANTGKDMFTPVSTPTTEKDITTGDSADISSSSASTPPVANAYTADPFTKQYIPNALCWNVHLYDTGSTEYQALQKVKIKARTQYVAATGSTNASVDITLPKAYATYTAYDKANKTYYAWFDARGPINGGKASDCDLVEKPIASGQSIKANPLQGTYVTDAEYYYAVDSGTDPTYVGARSKAIHNALVQIAALKGIDTITGFDYTIMPEEKYYPKDVVTGNIDYWIAVRSPK